MNNTVKSDEELLALLDRTMHEVARVAPEMQIEEAHHDYRWVATAAAAAIVIAAVGALVVSDRPDSRTVNPAADSTATLATSTPSGTLSAVGQRSLPSTPPLTIPEVFPSDVPRPDTFDSMTTMTWDGLPVGWEFFEQGQPTDSVARCTQYATTFDDTWTSRPKTDEADSVLYARFYENSDWQVGIYCTNLGEYLVQVMPRAT